MGAGKFYAAHAARALADTEGHALAVARAENDRQIKTLETKYRGEIEALRRDLAAAQTALRETQATNSRLVRQLQAGDDAYRKELAVVHAALNDSQAENERLRRRLKACDAVSRLIAAATQQEDGDGR
jgi:hypothetical protein